MAAVASPPTSSTPRHTQPVAERKRWSRASRSWWARFTFNGITRCEQGSYLLVGGEELSNVELSTSCCNSAASASMPSESNEARSQPRSCPATTAVRCNADKRVASCMFCAPEGSGRVLVENELELCDADASR